MYEHITVHEAAVEGKIPRALLFFLQHKVLVLQAYQSEMPID